MQIKALKYFIPFIFFVAAFWSFTHSGWVVWIPLMIAWVFIPCLELFIKPSAINLSDTEEELIKKDRFYDILLWLVVPFQYLALFFFLYSFQNSDLPWSDIIGRIWVMGLLCGIFGINVAHELGHRVNKWEQFLSKALLLTSLYMHFFIEHNKGHHKRVATHEDPSTARYGEPIYLYYYRTIIFSYLSAWKIANKDVRKKGKAMLSLHNEMVQFTIIEILFIIAIFYAFGWLIGIYFLAAAGIGIILLETVQYIEHYGLQRKSTGEGVYERTLPAHSWNSDHVLGRIMLFELSRHSDHHYLASRKYQILRHHDESPQMPTGYPGMMLLALVPPLWFYIMNRKIKQQQNVVTQE